MTAMINDPCSTFILKPVEIDNAILNSAVDYFNLCSPSPECHTNLLFCHM